MTRTQVARMVIAHHSWSDDRGFETHWCHTVISLGKIWTWSVPPQCLPTRGQQCVALEVDLRECTLCSPPAMWIKAAHSGFETQRRRHQKSKRGVPVAPQKGQLSTKNILKKNPLWRKKILQFQIPIYWATNRNIENRVFHECTF